MRFPNSISPLFAEFIGVILGDGMIGKYECDRVDGTKSVQHCVKVTFSSGEKQYCDYIENMFEQFFDFTPSVSKRKGEKTCDIRCFRQEIFDFLVEEVGMKVSPKWNKAKIPEEIFSEQDLCEHVLREYFDTDGSVVLDDNNGTLYSRLEMKICLSPMQDQFVDILEQLDFRFGTYENGKGKKRIQINGKSQLSDYKTKIGFNNGKNTSKAEKVS